MALSNDHIRYLRGLAHTLNPLVMVGNKGVSANLVDELAHALERHELVKIRVVAEVREDRDTLIEELLKTSGAELVQRIGHTAALFKRNLKKPKIVLPGAVSATRHSRSAPTGESAKPSNFERRREPIAGKDARPFTKQSRGPRLSNLHDKSFPIRESGDFEDRAQVIESPYKRRDANDQLKTSPHAERKPYARRQTSFPVPANTDERKPYPRREGSDPYRSAAGERKPYPRREDNESAYGVRREYKRSPNAKDSERKPFRSRDETGFNADKSTSAVRKERGAYRSGAYPKASERKREDNPYEKRVDDGSKRFRREISSSSGNTSRPNTKTTASRSKSAASSRPASARLPRSR